MQVAKAYHPKKDTQAVKLLRESELRKLITKEAMKKKSDIIVQIYLLKNKHRISLTSRKDWRTNNFQLPSDSEICYTYKAGRANRYRCRRYVYSMRWRQ